MYHPKIKINKNWKKKVKWNLYHSNSLLVILENL